MTIGYKYNKSKHLVLWSYHHYAFAASLGREPMCPPSVRRPACEQRKYIWKQTKHASTIKQRVKVAKNFTIAGKVQWEYPVPSVECERRNLQKSVQQPACSSEAQNLSKILYNMQVHGTSWDHARCKSISLERHDLGNKKELVPTSTCWKETETVWQTQCASNWLCCLHCCITTTH